ncbi:hypothetical protein [Rhodothermus marinus]|uniref:hypothetical protein n=1 Tax=Rhodothermus marinus TaxID=29549 RepID=UPI0012DF2756|nr:hypothetical protein [Rhodothermus marinus]
MTFQQAVEQASPPVNTAYQPGLQALPKRARAKLKYRDSRKLTGSIDLDGALADVCPNAPRWDYGLGIADASGREQALWIELHPATTSEIGVVLQKLAWLKNWLRTHGKALGGITEPGAFYWLATDGVHIQRGSPQARKLSQSGLKAPCRQLLLPC